MPMSEVTTPLPAVGTYRSFLVRLWQSHADGAWRASAQSIQSGATTHFADLDALFVFLQDHNQDSQAPQPYVIDEDFQ